MRDTQTGNQHTEHQMSEQKIITHLINNTQMLYMITLIKKKQIQISIRYQDYIRISIISIQIEEKACIFLKRQVEVKSTWSVVNDRSLNDCIITSTFFNLVRQECYTTNIRFCSSIISQNRCKRWLTVIDLLVHQEIDLTTCGHQLNTTTINNTRTHSNSTIARCETANRYKHKTKWQIPFDLSPTGTKKLRCSLQSNNKA